MFASLKKISATIKRELAVYRKILADSRTPFLAKCFLGLALAYLALPFDLIPDWIPVLGILDDVIIVPGLIWLSLRFIPRELIAEHRQEISSDYLKTLHAQEENEKNGKGKES